MKYLSILTIFILLGCNNNEKKSEDPDPEISEQLEEKASEDRKSDNAYLSEGETYSNEAFREVTLQRKGENTFLVEGKARLFEGTYNWVVEDGHRELKEGYGTTAAGAPQWGKFDFTVEAEKDESNSVLHLILFETSAKDGSRQHELIIPLY